MRLGQIKWQGATTAAIFNHTTARPIPDYTLCDLIATAEKRCAPLSEMAEELSIPRAVPAEPLIPLQPREVWGCRPQLFLKGTARVCVGPGQNIGIRSDSAHTAPEPELGIVLGARGRVLGYTLANDVSAWDIPQSKTFHASCALGPIMVTSDEITDPRDLVLSCTVTRGEEVVFSGESRIERELGSVVESLMRANPVPAGSVLLAGLGMAVDESARLAAGDSVMICVEQIGTLENSAFVVG